MFIVTDRLILRVEEKKKKKKEQRYIAD